MARSSDITSLTDYRARMKDYLAQVQETGRPLYLTANGKTAAVVLSPEAYDALLDKAELADTLIMLRRSEEDIKAGRVMDARTAIREIASDFGIDLDA